jgi:hypothetical protein
MAFRRSSGSGGAANDPRIEDGVVLPPRRRGILGSLFRAPIAFGDFLVGQPVRDAKKMMTPETSKRFREEVMGDISESLNATHKPSRIETFDEAVARQGLTEDQIQKRFKQFVLISRVFYLTSFVCIGISIFYFWAGTSILASIATMVWGLAGSLSGWKYAYRAWQIKIRRLALPIEGLRNPEAWFV